MILTGIVILVASGTSYREGKIRGREEGISWTLDTVNTMISRRYLNDSTIERLGIERISTRGDTVRKDTVYFFLSLRAIRKR